MNIAILLAAGRSERAQVDKLWQPILGLPVWKLAYDALAQHPAVDRVIVVARAGELERFRAELPQDSVVVEGGASRMESFMKGVAAAQPQTGDILLDHNAANPFVTAEEIQAVVDAAERSGAASLSHPVVDTIFQSDGRVYTQAHDRSQLRAMQTPQALRADLLEQLDTSSATDLTSALVPRHAVELVEASPQNKKITTKSDLLALQSHAAFGEDSHRFSESGALTLGGIQIDGCPAMEANSDGDVILHAIGRALAQLKNTSFSDHADALCESGEQNSAHYLTSLLEGVTIRRIAIQLECSRPKIDPLIPQLKASISAITKVAEERIHISAMTGEGLTSFGRGEGIRALCLLEAD